MPNNAKHWRERRVQMLLRAHPYLLDEDLLNCQGTIERTIRNGRLDIDFETETGWVIVECKITPLKDRDVEQICRYVKSCRESGKDVCKAYLVGGVPRKKLNSEIIQESSEIVIKHLLTDIPMFLAFSEGKHYFDADLEKCPYDGTRRIPGKEYTI